MRTRPPHAPNSFYHVTLRGNRQQALFHDVQDRFSWQRLLAQAMARYGARLHLYCWMTNHIHMVLECGDVPICRTLHLVAGGYARSFNAKYAHAGHLFQDRYGSRLIDTDTYLLQLIRYIHLNPVTAGIVTGPLEYRWSSHRQYLLADEDEWLTTTFVLTLFADEPSIARRRIAAFIDTVDGHHQSIDTNTHTSKTAPTPIAAFPADPAGPTLDQLITHACARFVVDAAMLNTRSRCRSVSRARAWIAWTAQRRGIATLTDVASRFDRHASSVSRSAARYHHEFDRALPQ